jgi:hypothetical protein
MCGFIDIFLNHSIVVHSLDKKKLLVFRITNFDSVLSSHLSDGLHCGKNNIVHTNRRNRSEKTNNIDRGRTEKTWLAEEYLICFLQNKICLEANVKRNKHSEVSQ